MRERRRKTETANLAPVSRLTLVGPSWPYRGGIAHFQAALHRALAERGHEVREVTFRRQYPDLLFPGTTQLDAGPPPDGLPLAERTLDSLNPLTWRSAARAIAETSDAAVLAYWMPFLGPMTGALARGLRQRGVRVLGLVHNAIPHERRPGDLALGRFALRACDGLIALSEQVGADAARLAPGVDVRVEEHPVYDFGEPVGRGEARAALGLPADAPVFLFFGFVRRYKGLHVLLDAWPRVTERFPDARLVVAGEFYSDEADLRAQAAPLQNVRFDADYIPDVRVPLYFGAADAVVQPYVSATQSGVAQIAFHFGRPVVTTDVGGLAEAVPDGRAGLVVPPDDPAALADALVRFASEDGLAERLAEGVRQHRERFSWGRLAEAVEELI